MKAVRPLSALVTFGVCAVALSACSSMRPVEASGSLEGAPAQPGRTLATPQVDGRTAEGGFIDAFSFSEKPGDVALAPVAFSAGTARAGGVIDPRHGSTWGGIALTASLSRGGRSVDASWAQALAVSLASPDAGTLRIRLVGPNTALRDSGCYPVAVVRVTPELKEYTLPIASFAPEPYCPPNAPAGVATTSALTAVEIADANVAPGHRRQVAFTVGVIRVMR
jgi:hypothetical protein